MKRLFYLLFFFAFLSNATVYAQSPDPATTRYVSTTGNTDPASATSWAASTSDLQGAINSLSATGGQVWVTTGTYKPTTYTDTDSRTVSFSMVDGVAIYGGFVGSETALSGRPAISPTTGNPSSSTLSGDIDNDGLLDSENSYHVIRNGALSAAAVLDGFVITGGNANYSSYSLEQFAGGMLNNGGSTPCTPTIRNCLFLANSASQYGGAIYNNGMSRTVSPIITNTVFESNTATVGGSIYNASQNGTNQLVLTNCLFRTNRAIEEGGAIYTNGENGSCEMLLTNCAFQDNSAQQPSDGPSYGGAVSSALCSITLNNCSFQHNTASIRGGAVYTISGTSTLLNCVFWNNGGTNSISNLEGGTSTASYCLFDASGDYTSTNSLTISSNPFINTTSTQLNTTSPAIDAGDPATTSATVETTDLGGNPRFYANGRIDIGAYEFQDIVLAEILQQPASESVGCSGGQVTVAVSATGTNISYRWYKDGAFLTGIASATTATLTLTNLTSASAGSYSVVVSGAYNTVTSTAFNLTVNTTPIVSIAANPSLTINSLETATLTASGATARYTWSTGQTSETIVVFNANTYSVTGVSDGCSAVASVVLTVTANCNSIIYVTPSGGIVRDGNSWTTAYPGTQLQQAIERAAYCGAQVWIAAGTYKPTSNTADVSVSFSMKNGVTIYGGFVGNETDFSQRPIINPVAGRHSNTILSGDIDGDGTYLRNSRHVFFNQNLNNTAVLDGVVITGGYADGGNAATKRGGGMANYSSSPTLTNCTFQSNTAVRDGGAILGGGNSIVLTNCVFENNYAGEDGGAIANIVSSTLVLTNCVFENNTAGQAGGAFYLIGGSVKLTNCQLLNNHSNDVGGVAYSAGTSLTLTNCLLQENSANRGGVFFNDNNSHPTLTNCTFRRNSATQSGGIAYNYNTVFVLTNSIGWENDLASTSTFYNQAGSTVTASYSLFDLSATGYTSDPTNLTTTVSPFVSATSLQLNSCSPAINAGDPATTTGLVGSTDLAGNARFYANGRIDMGAYEFQGTPDRTAITQQPASGSSVCVGSNVTITVSASGTGNSYQWYKDGTLLTDIASATTSVLSLTNVPTTATGSYSVVITGSCNSVTSTTFSLIVKTSPTRLYVKASATGANTGLDWENAFTDLQSALKYSCTSNLTEIWIAAGTYKPTSNTAETNVSFAMKNGVAIYGGFEGDETDLSQRQPINPVAGRHSNTILSGDIDGDGTSARNSQHVFYNTSVNNTAVLDGVVITAGYASGGNAVARRGGGMANYGSSPTLTNCSFLSNTAVYDGGAMYSSGGTAVLNNCALEKNYSGDWGGAIGSRNSTTVILTNCMLQNNTAEGDGGAIGLIAGRATLTNCILQNNKAPGRWGGALFADGGTIVVLTNCIVKENSADLGGAFFIGYTSLALTNCTLQSNTATSTGGAVHNNRGNLLLVNSIIWNNVQGSGSTFENIGSTTITAHYSLFDNAATGYSSDPTNLTTSVSPFASATSLQLNSCSPAINAGHPATTTATVGSTDLAENARFYANGRIDMGAYEFQGTSDRTAITQQPASGSSVCVGSNVTITVSASGTGNSYQWYKDGTLLTDIASATTSALSLTNVQDSDIAYYSVVVAGNCNSVTSSAFSLTVNSQPTATLSASPNATLTCTQTSLTLLASGGTSYSFAHLTGNGITSQDPNSGSAVVNQAGIYSVTVTSSQDCIASTTLLIASYTAPPSVSINVSGTITCGNSVTLTASGGASYTLLNTGQYNASGIFQVTSPATYTLLVNGANGCTTTSTTVVTSDSPLAIVQQPIASSAVCTDNTITAFVSVSGTGPFTYQWYKNGLRINGQASATLTLSNVQINDSGSYSVIITGSCTSATSTAFKLSVSPPALTPSATNLMSSGVLSTQNCQVQLSALATGQTFIFTGPGGYVFSNVYRTGGAYQIIGQKVTQPGMYTLTIQSGPGCDGVLKSAFYTIQVTGTACR